MTAARRQKPPTGAENERKQQPHEISPSKQHRHLPSARMRRCFPMPRATRYSRNTHTPAPPLLSEALPTYGGGKTGALRQARTGSRRRLDLSPSPTLLAGHNGERDWLSWLRRNTACQPNTSGSDWASSYSNSLGKGTGQAAGKLADATQMTYARVNPRLLLPDFPPAAPTHLA